MIYSPQTLQPPAAQLDLPVPYYSTYQLCTLYTNLLYTLFAVRTEEINTLLLIFQKFCNYFLFSEAFLELIHHQHFFQL